jgi:hypothetical protein
MHSSDAMLFHSSLQRDVTELRCRLEDRRDVGQGAPVIV